MPINNTRDRIARDCVSACLQLFMRRDQHPLPEIDGTTFKAVELRSMLRGFSTSESMASAVRAIDSFPYTIRIHQILNSARTDLHLTGVDHQIRRLLDDDQAGFEEALEQQWNDVRAACIALLREAKYPFEPVTDVPPPRDI
ncbi:hypothetical protein [Bradyrhizobium sp. cf659]|uniref:hypothetical protein n=1 Tax=Bradyrhizobium sp. cf659 TaxID=1761771 RepID=UPI0008F13D72|nr:hypothetical protein [Bradyrhizobium sp. cf659]SFJ54231.1 hypothetical protein SAMN04487925_108289 [Bradyrhizobium sp. cf659]